MEEPFRILTKASLFYRWAVQDLNLSPQQRQCRALPNELTARVKEYPSLTL